MLPSRIASLVLLSTVLALAQKPSAGQASLNNNSSISGALDRLSAHAVEAGHLVLVVPSFCKPPETRPPDILDQGEARGENFPGAGGMIDPQMAAAPGSTEAVAAQYGQQAFWFGKVESIAPMQVKVLHVDPDLANLPINQLVSVRPLPYLLSTLSREQWALLTGRGLKSSDLSDDQQALLRTALPRPFHIVPSELQDMALARNMSASLTMDDTQLQKLVDAYDQHIEAVGDAELQQISLRAFLSPTFSLYTPSGDSIAMTAEDDDWTLPGSAYKLATDSTFPDFNSNPVRQNLINIFSPIVPNTLKPGDLDWDSPTLQAAISVDKVKTIGDLVDAVGKATGVELYADPRYAKQEVKFVGDRTAAQPACDLLRAVTLCAGGAWRKVGPAYVLTNDIQGYGAQGQRIDEIVAAWSNRLIKTNREIKDRLAKLDWGHSLSFAEGSPGALTTAQRDATIKGTPQQKTYIRWGDLPASAQASLRKRLQVQLKGQSSVATALERSILTGLKPDMRVSVSYSIQFGLQLPRTGVMLLGDIFDVKSPAIDSANIVMPTSDKKAVLTEAKRGVLCVAGSPQEAKMAVDRLAGMGLNTLYLDVFNNGCAYFPNDALRPETDDAARTLGAAIEEGKARHVDVVGVVDVFRWRSDMDREHPHPLPVGYQEDITITGEAPWNAIQRRLVAGEVDPGSMVTVGPVKRSGWVSPTEPSVQKALPEMLSALASVPGIAGIALQDTSPPGIVPRDAASLFHADVGYTLRNRLAILRQSHTDPIDSGRATAILQSVETGMMTNFSLDLPTFPAMNASEDLRALLRSTDTDLLASCYRAIKATNPTLPLLMRERMNGFTFDPWTSPDMPNELPARVSDATLVSRINSASILTVPTLYGSLKNVGILRFLVDMERNEVSKGKQGGVLIDLVMSDEPESLSDALDAIEAAVDAKSEAQKSLANSTGTAASP